MYMYLPAPSYPAALAQHVPCRPRERTHSAASCKSRRWGQPRPLHLCHNSLGGIQVVVPHVALDEAAERPYIQNTPSALGLLQRLLRLHILDLLTNACLCLQSLNDHLAPCPRMAVDRPP